MLERILTLLAVREGDSVEDDGIGLAGVDRIDEGVCDDLLVPDD